MDAVAISAIVSGGVSAALELVPGLNDLWNGVAAKWKPAVVLVLSVGVPFAVGGLACANVSVGFEVACIAQGNVGQNIVDLLMLGATAWGSSQVAFRFVSEPLGASLRRSIASEGGVG